VLYLNPKVGVIDLVMNPKSPDTLYAATYDKQRLPWQMINGGPGSGIHKTTDGGKTWTRLESGLPKGRIGRIGLDIYRKNPDILYAVVENDNPRTGPAPGGRGQAAGVVNIIGGEVYRTENGGQSWTKMNADDYNVSPKGPYYFSQIRVDPNNDQRIFVTQGSFRHSQDGGKTWDTTRTFPRMFGNFRTLWIDPENSDRMIAGSDASITMSYDGGVTSDHYANIPVGEIYSISVDMEEPYNIYAGLQDHENWRGPSNTGLNRVTGNDWLAVGDGDGMSTLVDPTDSRWLYTNREYGSHYRLDQKFGIRTSIMPRRPQGQPPYRFIWETPIYMSPHDSRVIYTGGQVLLRSTDRGDHWTEISPDLSTNPPDKILPSSEGGVPGGIPWFAISSISESPVTRGVIWAGTSDGKVHVMRDDGAAWTDATGKIAAAGGREDAYVSRIRASSHAAGPGLRVQDWLPIRRFQTLSVSHGRLRRDVEVDLREPPQRADQRHLRGSQESQPPLRRQRHRRLRVDRRRRALGEDEQQHAQRAGERSPRASPRQRSRDRIVRTRSLDREHRAAAGARRIGAGEGRPFLQHRADHPARPLAVCRQRLLVRPAAPADAERDQRDDHSLLPEEGRRREAIGRRDRRQRPRSGQAPGRGRRWHQLSRLDDARSDGRWRPRRRPWCQCHGAAGAARRVHRDARSFCLLPSYVAERRRMWNQSQPKATASSAATIAASSAPGKGRCSPRDSVPAAIITPSAIGSIVRSARSSVK
jgi:hypothetical protein